MCSVRDFLFRFLTNDNCRGLIVYDRDEIIPSVILPMNVQIPCQTKASIGIDLFARKDSFDNEEKSSDVFDSIYVPQTRATRSIKSQSFSRNPYSSSNK